MTSKHWWLVALLALGVAAAQDPPAEPDDVDPAAEELLDESLDEDDLGDVDAAEQVAPEEELPEAPEPDPAAAAGEMNATMERFVPSEQISEDRSVSFPNDI